MFPCLPILAASFYLFLCISRLAMTPSLCRVTLFSKCPVGPSGTVSTIAWSGYSRSVPCVCYVSPPVVLSLDCFWAICVWGQPSAWLAVKNDKLLCKGWPHEGEFTLAGYCACQDLLLDLALMLSEAGHHVCWFWGLLGGTLVQMNIRYCLWLAMGNLFRVVSMWHL